MNQSVIDFSIQAAAAYYQAGMIVAGLAACALGLFAGGDWFYWRTRATRTTGRLTGVRQKGKFYYPVYTYADAYGKSVEATSSVGTSSASSDFTSNLEQQGPVGLMVFPENPSAARPIAGIDANLPLYVALFAGSVGLFFVIFACVHYPFTRMTFFLVAALIAYGVVHIHRMLFPDVWSIGDLKAAGIKNDLNVDQEPIQPISPFLSSPVLERGAISQKQNAGQFRIVFALIGIPLICCSVYLSLHTFQMVREGVRVSGSVTSLVLSGNSPQNPKSTFYAMVHFKTDAGETVEFKDNIGSNPPSFQPGDTVTVIYLPTNPQGNAMVDRGIWNALPPFLAFGFGAILLIIGWKTRGKAATKI